VERALGDRKCLHAELLISMGIRGRMKFELSCVWGSDEPFANARGFCPPGIDCTVHVPFPPRSLATRRFRFLILFENRLDSALSWGNSNCRDPSSVGLFTQLTIEPKLEGGVISLSSLGWYSSLGWIDLSLSCP
jgi:hypothetical protein